MTDPNTAAAAPKLNAKSPLSEREGGFSNTDDNIRSQQARDIAEEREDNALPPDPAGERHAPDAQTASEE